jgi:hypothetical protein
MTEGMNLPVATCLEFLVIAVRLIRNQIYKRNIFALRDICHLHRSPGLVQTKIGDLIIINIIIC